MFSLHQRCSLLSDSRLQGSKDRLLRWLWSTKRRPIEITHRTCHSL